VVRRAAENASQQVRRIRHAVARRFACFMALFFIPLPSASQYPTSQLPAHPSKEFEMELLIGFVTTLFISLLIFRT
jgi:hypothetical protein